MFDVTLTIKLEERDIEWILESMNATYDENNDMVYFEYNGSLLHVPSVYVAMGINDFLIAGYKMGIGLETSLEGLSNDDEDVKILKDTIVEILGGN